MDIRVIALYLAGKLPPYYKFRPNLYRFNRVILEKAGNLYNKEELLSIDKLTNNQGNQLDTYFYNVLDDLYQEDENIFCKVIKELKIPKEVLKQAGVDIVDIYNFRKNKKENYRQKLIEYIINNIPRLYFMDKLNKDFNISFEKLKFWWKQANQNEKEFYTLVLDYFLIEAKKEKYYKIKVDKFFQELNIPKELYIEITDEDIQKLVDYLIDKNIKIKEFINIIKECGINKDLSNYMFEFKSEKIYKRLLKELDKQEIIKIMEYFNLLK